MPPVAMMKASLLLSWPKETTLPAMATPAQGTGLLFEHLTLGIRAEVYTWRSVPAGVSAAAQMEEP
jgi:hypothetical protein